MSRTNPKERKMSEKRQPLAKPRPLIEYFEDLPDPRMDRSKKHKLVDILVIGLCSQLTGGSGFSDMETFGRIREDWLRTFLELPEGIPSHDTFNRCFAAIDPYAFLDCFVAWVQGICPALEGETVAIDGKALRRALNEGESIPYIVSAWASDNGLALGQVKVKDKSNEITAIPELLQVLELKGCIVTIDAMGCQKKIAANIIDKSADYVLSLKGNHETVHDEVKAFFDDAVGPRATQWADTVLEGTMDFHQTIEKGHGRIETRRYWQSTDLNWFDDKRLWKGLRSFGMVESIREIKGQSSIERRFFLSSLPLDAKKLARSVRGHWGVENALHWSLDLIFDEDHSRARTRNAAQNVATLRRIALNLIKKTPREKTSQRQKLFVAALDPRFLEKLLGI
jgi:predicted transposase YbfD/YdcC